MRGRPSTVGAIGAEDGEFYFGSTTFHSLVRMRVGLL
jgi:hypothetical protein